MVILFAIISFNIFNYENKSRLPWFQNLKCILRLVQFFSIYLLQSFKFIWMKQKPKHIFQILKFIQMKSQ